MEGATTENGPLVLYRIKESYDLATGQLSDNAYAWNKQGHVLYVDQPKGVGNSFGYGEGCKSSVDAGLDIVTFIQGWYDLFPEHATRKVVISGESYGGHYIPAWANAILDHNQGLADTAAAAAASSSSSSSSASAPSIASSSSSSGSHAIPMVGLAIGNGCVNNTVQDSDKYIEFLQVNNLLPEGAQPKSQLQAEALMIKNLGYQVPLVCLLACRLCLFALLASVRACWRAPFLLGPSSLFSLLAKRLLTCIPLSCVHLLVASPTSTTSGFKTSSVAPDATLTTTQVRGKATTKGELCILL